MVNILVNNILLPRHRCRWPSCGVSLTFNNRRWCIVFTRRQLSSTHRLRPRSSALSTASVAIRWFYLIFLYFLLYFSVICVFFFFFFWQSLCIGIFFYFFTEFPSLSIDYYWWSSLICCHASNSYGFYSVYGKLLYLTAFISGI